MAKAFINWLLCGLAVVGLCATATGQILSNKGANGGLETARQCVVDRAMSQRHVRERTGRNDGREVEQYLALVGFRRGTPWCGAFVNWCYVQCGQRIAVRSPALAASWVADRERLVWSANQRGGKRIRDGPPRPGDVAAFRWYGQRINHVEVVIEWADDDDEEEFLTVGGNTTMVGGQEGVYLKRRDKEGVLIADWLSETGSPKLKKSR